MKLTELTKSLKDTVSKAYLKWKLKRLYMKINYGFEDYNCGHKMLLGISSKYYRYCKRFNGISDKLSEIDEDCPKFRYDLFTHNG